MQRSQVWRPESPDCTVGHVAVVTTQQRDENKNPQSLKTPACLQHLHTVLLLKHTNTHILVFLSLWGPLQTLCVAQVSTLTNHADWPATLNPDLNPVLTSNLKPCLDPQTVLWCGKNASAMQKCPHIDSRTSMWYSLSSKCKDTHITVDIVERRGKVWSHMCQNESACLLGADWVAFSIRAK